MVFVNAQFHLSYNAINVLLVKVAQTLLQHISRLLQFLVMLQFANRMALIILFWILRNVAIRKLYGFDNFVLDFAKGF